MLEKIDFYPGKVVFNDLRIDLQLSFQENSEYWILEDLLQVLFPRGFLLDVGWHATSLTVRIVKDNDWDNSIFTKKCTSFSELETVLIECVGKIRNLIEIENKNKI